MLVAWMIRDRVLPLVNLFQSAVVIHPGAEGFWAGFQHTCSAGLVVFVPERTVSPRIRDFVAVLVAVVAVFALAGRTC